MSEFSLGPIFKCTHSSVVRLYTHTLPVSMASRWKPLRQHCPSGPDGQRIIDRIAAGIDKNGAWKSKILCDFMCGEMYAFFNENAISKEKLETFLKTEYKMERGAAAMANSVVNSLLEGIPE